MIEQINNDLKHLPKERIDRRKLNTTTFTETRLQIDSYLLGMKYF